MYELFPAVCAVLATDPRPRGMCLSLCGPYGVECPSGYECRSNGCGHECFRPANYVVPEGKKIEPVFAEAFDRSELFLSPVVFFSRTTEPNSTERATNYVDADKTTFKKSSPDPPNNLGIRHPSVHGIFSELFGGRGLITAARVTTRM